MTKNSKKKKQFILFIVFLTSMCIILTLINLYVFSPARVNDISMKPTLTANEIVLVNKFSYIFDSPERYDIVVFKPQNDTNLLVKRVIGLPGETVEIIDDIIYIDGEILYEYYGLYEGEQRNSNYSLYKLKKDEYFVIGDNRYNSEDSRSDAIGPISRDSISGKLFFRIWPFNAFGGLENQ